MKSIVPHRLLDTSGIRAGTNGLPLGQGHRCVSELLHQHVVSFLTVVLSSFMLLA